MRNALLITTVVLLAIFPARAAEAESADEDP